MARSPKKTAGAVVAKAAILVDGQHFDEGEEITGVDKDEIGKVVRMGRAEVVDAAESAAE